MLFPLTSSNLPQRAPTRMITPTSPTILTNPIRTKQHRIFHNLITIIILTIFNIKWRWPMIWFNYNYRFISCSICIKFIFRITIICIWNNLMIINDPVIMDYTAVGLLGYEGVS